MALQLNKTLNSGVTGNYWRIIDIRYLPKSSLMVTLGLYLDRAARESGRETLFATQLSSSRGKLALPDPSIGQEIINYCYSEIKKLDEYQGAVDA